MFVKDILLILCLVYGINCRHKKHDTSDDTPEKPKIEVTSSVPDITTENDVTETNENDGTNENDDKNEEINKRDEIPHENPMLGDGGETSDIRSPKRMRIDSAEEEEDYEEASTASSGEDFSGNGDEGSDLVSVTLNKDEMTLLHAIEALSKRHYIEKGHTKSKTHTKKGMKKQHIAHASKRTKQCEKKVKRCSVPMTFVECAIPRCREKVRPVRGLCFWLCKHQKKHCVIECEE